MGQQSGGMSVKPSQQWGSSQAQPSPARRIATRIPACIQAAYPSVHASSAPASGWRSGAAHRHHQTQRSRRAAPGQRRLALQIRPGQPPGPLLPRPLGLPCRRQRPRQGPAERRRRPPRHPACCLLRRRGWEGCRHPAPAAPCRPPARLPARRPPPPPAALRWVPAPARPAAAALPEGRAPAPAAGPGRGQMPRRAGRTRTAAGRTPAARRSRQSCGSSQTRGSAGITGLRVSVCVWWWGGGGHVERSVGQRHLPCPRRSAAGATASGAVSAAVSPANASTKPQPLHQGTPHLVWEV